MTGTWGIFEKQSTGDILPLTLLGEDDGAGNVTAGESVLGVLGTDVAGGTSGGGGGGGGPSTRDTVVGQVTGKVILGLAVDDWAARTAETGPVGALRSYSGTWSPSGVLSDSATAHSRGVIPYVSCKTNPSTWAQVAAGALDADIDQLANNLDALGYPVRFTVHHEPAGKTAAGAGDNGTPIEWSQMLTRVFTRMRAITSNVVYGPTDNGYKWSAKGQGWPDSELNQVYTDSLLAVCDVIGADCYDGSKQSSPQVWGEPAYIKAQRMIAWADRRGWNGPLDLGEWNFIRPQDCTAMWATLSGAPDYFWLACCFDSDTNNRTDIPNPPGHWNFTHDYATTNDRLNAFKAALTDPISVP